MRKRVLVCQGAAGTLITDIEKEAFLTKTVAIKQCLPLSSLSPVPKY